ncbi:MAG: acetolactate synthase small subunit [Armatimonadetes bacterium RBG_16_58_9]|nr:MAG: acetolactate synthase small subunit [Armatimonadetes bacterium RBG_16_58_9]
MQHTVTVLVENKPGVLARVSGLFARRGFNIESLAVSITDDPTVSRMTIVVSGDASTLEQINKQTNKLIDVIRVIDYSEVPIVDRELALIKVTARAGKRAEIMQITDVFRAKIIDISQTTFTIEVTGSVEKVDAIERLLSPFGIQEVVRTGKIAMARGAHTAMAQ